MSSTVTESTAPVSVTDLGPSGLKYRSLKAARDAYSCEDDNTRQQLSREAHSLLSKPKPGSPLLPPTSTWSPWAADAEAGHNEELAYRGQTLLLRGGVDGIIMSLFILSLGDAAGWTLMRTLTLNAVLLGCWAIYSAGREALEVLTYRAHYARERSREAWELDNFPEGEVEEMVQLYCKRGLPEHAARSVISTMAAHSSKFFVDVMMLEELQMSPPAAISGLSAAARICTSGLVCGSAPPLAACAVDRLVGHEGSSAPFVCACVLGACALGYLGSRRADITHQSNRMLALQTMALAVPVVLFARALGGPLLASAV